MTGGNEAEELSVFIKDMNTVVGAVYCQDSTKAVSSDAEWVK